MKNKKLAILAAVCLVTATAAVTTACKKPSEPTYEVTLSSESLNLMIGTSETLTSTTTQVSGTALVYASSNPSVVTVDEAGTITAVSKGTATITATYGTATDTCTVTVDLGGNVPELVLNNAESETTVNQYTVLDMTGYVSFNGENYEDAVLTYEVENEAVGTIANGTFTPAGAGTTEVSISANWRGFTVADAITLSTTISITVENHWDYTINGEELVTEATLYTIAEDGYPNQTDFAVVATVDGLEIDSTVAVKSGKNIVTYDATTKKLTATGTTSGKATVAITVNIDGQELTKTIAVTVLPTIYEKAEIVENFSEIHGDVITGDNLKTILGGSIVSAYAEDDTKLDVRSNKIYNVFEGVERDTTTNMYERTITICSSTKGIKMTVKGYSGIFTKAQDLAVLNTNTNVKLTLDDGSTTNVAIDETKGMQKWENKYFVLANNIDASQYVHAANGKLFNQRGMESYTFPCGMWNSTFDGQGYTIKGMTLSEFGLFGYVKNSTIKDLALVDTKLADVAYATTIAQYIIGGTISNVYVNVTNTQITKAGAIFAGGVINVTMEAVVIETSATLTDTTTGYDGIFAYQNPAVSKATTENPFVTPYSEVYVISATTNALGAGKAEVNGEAANVTFHAENVAAGTEEGRTYFSIAGIKQYAPGAEMTDATFTKFNAFWDTTSGKPVWKSASGEFAPPVADEEDVSSDHVVEDFNPDWLN